LQVARENQLAPDGHGRFDGFINAPPGINQSGNVAFFGRLRDTQGGELDNLGMYRGDGTLLTQMVRGGQLGPGGNGRFVDFSYLSLNSTGEIAFLASLTGTAAGVYDRAGIFRSDGSTVTQIARLDDVAPGGTTRFLGLGVAALNDEGQVAFEANLFGPEYGIFRGDGVSLIPIARSGQTTPDGSRQFVKFSSFNVGINNHGDVVFVGRFHATSGDGNEGIYRGDGTTLVEIARTGQLTPDSSGRFFAFSSSSADSFRGNLLNDAGQVAFRARLNSTVSGGDETEGIFIGDGEALDQIARGGQPAPDGNGVFSQLLFPVLNNSGQLAFSALLRGTSGSSSDDRGIYFYDPREGLRKVAREGDPFLGSRLTNVSISASFDPAYDERKALNDAGQLAFSFILADGRRGIAIWTVPEPATVVLLSFGIAVTAFRRRFH
jgi:hypothetical protein